METPFAYEGVLDVAKTEAKGNKGFAERFGVASRAIEGESAAPDIQEDQHAARKPLLDGVIAQRKTNLSDLTSGMLVEHEKRFVDPDRCVMWKGHNRIYDALNKEKCLDLIESIIAHGKQEMPAIVRRVSDDPDTDYEVICGARRHWAISWLRKNNYPNFLFLIEIRLLTDEEAFRIADLENRERKDISDYERAVDYLRAVDQYYKGSQQQMADRLGVNKVWLSRYLDLAKMPNEILVAYPSKTDVALQCSRNIMPLWRVEENQEKMAAEASVIAGEQAKLREEGAPPIAAAVVRRRIIRTTVPKKSKVPQTTEFTTASGSVMLSAERAKNGSIKIFIPAKTGASKEELASAFSEYLNQMPVKKP
jgi:ParB family transcriptional regulator, chromosome partitioning protein